MQLLDVIILAVIEGITEFLPISSTGHLILASKILAVPETDFLKTFEVVIQLGAILAVFVLYSEKLLSNVNLVKKVLFAFIPTAIVGFVLYPFIKNVLLGSTYITLQALFWGGIALLIVEWVLSKRKKEAEDVEEVSYLQALLIGVFQSFSVVPGVSRAAATIIGGILVGSNRRVATEFSFLLAIPTMFAASAFDLYKNRDMLVSGNMIKLFVGATLSFIFAMLTVRFLVNYVEKHNFSVFGVYRIVLAIVFWLFVM